MSNVAFVASTVPVVLLHRIIANKKINTIVLRRDLVKSYQYLLDSHDNIKLIILKSNVITSTLQILLLLLLLKIKNNKIYFFHECCWPILDLLIGIIRPAGHYYPQINMDNYPISKSIICKSLFCKFAVFTRFYLLFDIHVGRGDNERHVKWEVYKNYPKSIVVHTIKDLIDDNTLDKSLNKRVIFFLSRESISDIELREFYNQLILKVLEIGYECHIKDHPRKSARINLSILNCKIIDPYMPAELIYENYCFAIGVSSTALINFRGEGISVLHLMKRYLDFNFKSTSNDDHIEEMKHRLTYRLRSKYILMPENMKNFSQILTKNFHENTYDNTNSQ